MSEGSHEISVSLRDLVAFFVRGALLAGALAILVGVGTYLVGQRGDPVFRAEATLLVVRSTTGFSQLGLTPVTAPPIDIAAYRVAVESDSVLNEALTSLGVASPSVAEVRSLRGNVGSAVDAGVRDSSLLRVEGRGISPETAVARANAVGYALVEWDRRRASETMSRVIATLEQRIEAVGVQIRTLQVVGDAAALEQVDALARLRAEQQQQLSYARALIASAEGLVSVLQTAESTVRQIAPRPLMNALVAALLTMVGVYLLLLLRAAFDTRMRGADAIAAATGARVLAEFPVARPRDAWRLREASSYLRAQLLFATIDAHPRVLLVSSAQDQEGKTTVARHLAESFVRYGYRTLLVDADLRSPSVIDYYQVVGAGHDVSSLQGWLRDPEGNHRVLRINLDGAGPLDVVPQYERAIDAPEALGRGFSRLLERWIGYDVVVVDSAPILAVADTLILAPMVTGTVLVVNPSRSDRPSVEAAAQMLRSVGGMLLGVVPNKVATARRRFAYGEGYGDGKDRARPNGPKAESTKEMARPASLLDAG